LTGTPRGVGESMNWSKASFLLAVVLGATCLRFWWTPAEPVRAQSRTLRSAGIKITFGVRNPAHDRVWSGGVRDASQVRKVQGWHFSVKDSIRPPERWNITLQSVGGDVAAKGVILDLASPENQPVTVFTRYGDFSFVPADLPYGVIRPVELFRGDVTLERVPLPQTVTSEQLEDDDPALLRTRSGEYWLAWVAYATRKRDGHNYTGGDQIMIARSRDGQHWETQQPLTAPGDHFRVALAEDGRGHVWCVYAWQKQQETGNFDLYAREYDGKAWSREQQLTSSPFPDHFHRMASSKNGNVYLVWIGFRPGSEGGAPQSDVLLRVLSNGRWGDEVNISQSGENDWEPAVSADSSGRAWIAWDSYRAAANGQPNYDLLVRSFDASGLGRVQTVSGTALAEMRADVAVDGRDRVWVTWEEAGANWGKDTGYENPRHKIWLRPGGSRLYGPPNSDKALYRRPRVAVFDGGRWQQTKARIEDAWPDTMRRNLFLNPRLGVDSGGQVWLLVKHQLIAQGRNGGQFFDSWVTTLSGDGEDQKWLTPILLPASSARQDVVVASTAAEDGLAIAVVGDGRRFPVPLPLNHDISTLLIARTGVKAAGPAVLEPFLPSDPGQIPVTHPDESNQVAAVRSYRIDADGQRYKIIRGDTHRHTEISMDGAVDGSLWDLYRYALDAANLDYVAVTDHNYGAWLDTDEPESKNTDNEYQWWRTQKSADLFYVPGRFVPLYGYERSVNFPRGHRNIFHVRRGVFPFRVPKLFLRERPELIENDATGLWAYLRGTNGVGLPHSTGTNMGTDWKYLDDSLEPVAELYSGDWGAFEENGQPRAATPEAQGGGFSGRAPFVNGLIWNALGVGYKLGFIASSDHWSTHIAYANLLVPDRATTRADILDAFRSRHTYASTDNIVLDFSAGPVVQGGELQAARSPTFRIRVRGTEPILRVEVIKNNRIVFTRGSDPSGGDPKALEFTWRDTDSFADTSMAPTGQIRNWDAPETGIRKRPNDRASYYYVRVTQQFSKDMPNREGEIAWSSPIYVRQ
jgi:hypothetical protein